MRAGRPLAALFVLAGACATAEPAQKKQEPEDAREVDVLRERVGRLERRLSDVDARLAVLMEAASRRGSTTAATSAVAPPVAPEPPRTSIDLPRGAPVDEEPVEQDDAEPIVIRVEGDAAPRFDGPAPAPTTTSAGDAKALYDWAMERRKANEHLEAIAAFEDIQERFPGHDLADNAMYWTGACHAERGDRRLAIAVWQKLPLKHPKSPKVPDALYGMAQAHEALGEPAIAETLYSELVRAYPKAERTPEARRALQRLRPR